MMNSIQSRTSNFSSSLHSRRSLNELSPHRERSLAPLEPLPLHPAAPIVKKPIPGRYKPDITTNKWYKEPKIPIQLNSSTLIRRKTHTNSNLDNVVRNEPNNQLALNALTFLKRERRACDLVHEKYEIAPKGMLPFDKSSYIKDVLSKIVSSGDNSSLQEQKVGLRPSANPSGDGVDRSGTYHRVSALSINDLKSGCNLKYFEEVSFQANTSTLKKPNDDMTTEVVTKLENVRVSSQCTREWNPTKSEFISKFTTPCQVINHDNCSDDNDDAACKVIIKKKTKKSKKPVVVTCLKNSTVKFVKRKST